MKQIILFALVSSLTGFAAGLASVLGASVSHVGLFIGAVLGGFTGVAAAIRLSKALRLITAHDIWFGILGGCIGFLVAAPLAATNAHTPVIPILSTGLVGLGALTSLQIRRWTHKR